MPRSKIASFARKRPPYFWWLLAHALALCFCVLSWMLTNYVFANPELPKNYALLKKIGQAPIPKTITALEAPEGDSSAPTELYRKYAPFSLPDNAQKLQKNNYRLMRSYLRTYTETTKPTYIEGNYRVLQIRPLTKDDIIYPGFVIRAQALVKPDKDREPSPYPVMIEYIFPTDHKAAFSWFKPGDLMKVQKIPDCVAILRLGHLGTEDEPIINLTVVPIAYSEYKIGTGRVLTIMPPENINLLGKFPLFPNATSTANP